MEKLDLQTKKKTSTKTKKKKIETKKEPIIQNEDFGGLAIGCSDVELPKEENFVDTNHRMSLYDIFKDISTNGGFIDNYIENYKKLPQEYNQWLINIFFSHFKDTLFQINEINKNYNAPDICNYYFLKNTIQKRNRFTRDKVVFKEKEHDDINLLAKFFGFSYHEMEKNLSAIPANKLAEILEDLKKDEKNR